MLVLGIILCYVTGLAVMLTISRKYSLAELLGFSFLLGMGIQTTFLFGLDVIGVTYSTTVLIVLNLLVSGALFGLSYKKLNEFTLSPDPKGFFELKNINIPAIMLWGMIAYLVYGVTVKCLFWPPLARDTIGSFDKLARVMAAEGKLKISLFNYGLEGAGGIYPPLYHASMAYVYIFGAELPKIVTTLFFVSTLLVFFGVVRKYVGATAASFFTLIMMITPEYFSHAALALGNLPTTAYVGAGALCTIAWIEKNEQKYFWLGGILMGFAVWIRSDTIVFTAAALAVVGLRFLFTKQWKETLIYGALATAPFVIWALYLKFKIHNVPSAKFDFGIGFNPERWAVVKGYTSAYLLGGKYSFNGIGGIDGGQLFGLSFVLLFVVLFVNVVVLGAYVYLKRDWKKVITSQYNILLFFFISLTAYFLLFYFIDAEVQRSPIWSLMYSSFKRGLFCFLPLSFFYIATSYASVRFWSFIENFRVSGKLKP